MADLDDQLKLLADRLAPIVGIDPREAKELADIERELRAIAQQRDEANLVPGVMRCAKCAFQLHRTTLYMGSGTIGPGDSKTEPCPNGCGPLWPVTWQQWATEAHEYAERMQGELVLLKTAGRASAAGWARPCEVDAARRNKDGSALAVFVHPERTETCSMPIYACDGESIAVASGARKPELRGFPINQADEE